MQGRVPRGVLGSRLSSVEEQMFQMLRMTPLAGLEGTGGQSPGQTHLATASLSPSPGGQAALHLPLPLPSPLRPHSCLGTHTVNATSRSKAQASRLTPQSPGGDTSMLPLWGPCYSHLRPLGGPQHLQP